MWREGKKVQMHYEIKMMDEISVSNYEEQIILLMQELKGIYHGCNPILYCESKYKDMMKFSQDGTAIIAGTFLGNMLIAYIWGYFRTVADKKGMHITQFVVSEKYRKYGIGKALLAYMEKYAKKRDCRLLELNVEGENYEAQSFYKNNGFVCKNMSMQLSLNDMAEDIYFDKNYGKLYEKMENGTAEIFNYQDENGKIQSQFIKRKIPVKLDDIEYYDLVTPYGYGGPIILECNGNREELVKGFAKESEVYCHDNKIVSEFIRFHPVLGNALDFKDVYEVSFDRHTAGTDLGRFDNPFQEEFSKSARKNVRQALDKGIAYKITKAPDNIHNFKEIYYSTMKRNGADEFYYFDVGYFNQCIELYRNHILLVEAIYEEKIIAAGFYFVWKDMIHTHLSGTLSEYLHLSPSYILRYAAVLWGKENHYKIIHHGGGTDNRDDNTLYQFKKRFGKNTEFDFYTGRKIWNKEIYDRLCCITGAVGDSGYFPAYRSGMI